jgi:hypothetical protein
VVPPYGFAEIVMSEISDPSRMLRVRLILD